MNDATFLDFVMLCMFALPLLAVATMAFLFWRKDKQQREANERIFALLLRRDDVKVKVEVEQHGVFRMRERL